MRYETLIDSSELARRLGSSSLVILDARHVLTDADAGFAGYRRGHLPGAHFLHMDRDLSGPKNGSNGRHPLPEREAAARTFAALGVSADTQVVVYDQNNSSMAVRAWWMLRWLGHRAVAVLDGGFDRWLAEGHPIDTGTPQAHPARFDAKPGDPTARADELLANLGSAAMLVVDARAPERFRGDVEPLDPVAGHIPGAVNRPFADNLDADGRFKCAETLRAEWNRVLGGRDPATVVHHCGSGITGCHNVLAMQIAGLGTTRLYPGSWSEWCADPTRPVARGPA